MSTADLVQFFSHVDVGEITLASVDTLVMLIASLALSVALGLPLGVWL